MKIILILLAVAVQCNAESKDLSLDEAIKNGQKNITKTLKFNENYFSDIYMAIATAAVQFVQGWEKITEDLEEVKAYYNFDKAYASYLTEIDAFMRKVEKVTPEFIANYYKLDEFTQIAYEYPSKVFADLELKIFENACKKQSFQKLEDLAAKNTVQESTKCILNAIERVHNFPSSDYKFLTKMLTNITEVVLLMLQQCENIDCVLKLVNEARYQTEYVVQANKNYEKDIKDVIILQNDVTDKCLSNVRNKFDTNVSETIEAIEKC